jgi:hypothetical protein
MSKSTKKESPRKPTGMLGRAFVGSDAEGKPAAGFIPITYGESKQDIEAYFINAAMRNALRDALHIEGEPQRNGESSFDFTISMPNGKEYIDLMEIALLEGGFLYERAERLQFGNS